MARAQQSGLVEVGHFLHPCENDLVCSTTCGKIPFFNAPIYFENEEQVGKVDEIFGSPQEHGFSVKLSEGIKASAFTPNQTLFIEGAKLLPVDRFLPGAKPFNRPSRGGGGMRGRGRGSFRGRGSSDRGGRGFGNSRGSSRGRGSGGRDFGNSRGSSRGRGSGGDRGGFRGRGFGNDRNNFGKRNNGPGFAVAKKQRFD